MKDTKIHLEQKPEKAFCGYTRGSLRNEDTTHYIIGSEQLNDGTYFKNEHISLTVLSNTEKNDLVQICRKCLLNWSRDIYPKRGTTLYHFPDNSGLNFTYCGLHHGDIPMNHRIKSESEKINRANWEPCVTCCRIDMHQGTEDHYEIVTKYD